MSDDLRSDDGGFDRTRALLLDALDAFGQRVQIVPEDAWPAPTPCEQWTVLDLVDHLVTEHLWVPHLLGGETVRQVGNRFDGDVLGSDPPGAWEDACAGSRDAWASLTSGREVVHLSSGETPASEYAEQMLLDLTVHGWDLARGAGVDDRMDGAAAQHVLAYAEGKAAGGRDAGIFGDPVDTGSQDPQDRLLGLLGRDPGWAPGPAGSAQS